MMNWANSVDIVIVSRFFLTYDISCYIRFFNTLKLLMFENLREWQWKLASANEGSAKCNVKLK